MESPSFIEFIADELQEIAELHTHRMFGGVGLYCGHRMFGLIYDGRVYFRTSNETRNRYVDVGMEFFSLTQNRSLRCYYEVPKSVVEQKEKLLEWAHDAVEAD